MVSIMSLLGEIGYKAISKLLAYCLSGYKLYGIGKKFKYIPADIFIVVGKLTYINSTNDMYSGGLCSFTSNGVIMNLKSSPRSLV